MASTLQTLTLKFKPLFKNRMTMDGKQKIIPSSSNVFNRGSLMHTFDLIRKKEPELALIVRNITGGTPIPKTEEQPDNKHTDFFEVTLDSFQVRAVVEALMEYSQTADQETGSAVVARTLLEDWIKLAHQMISELPDDQKP